MNKSRCILGCELIDRKDPFIRWRARWLLLLRTTALCQITLATCLLIGRERQKSPKLTLGDNGGCAHEGGGLAVSKILEAATAE